MWKYIGKTPTPVHITRIYHTLIHFIVIHYIFLTCLEQYYETVYQYNYEGYDHIQRVKLQIVAHRPRTVMYVM